MVTHSGDSLYLVVNAARKAHDFGLLKTSRAENSRGPRAARAAGAGCGGGLARLVPRLASMPFMSSDAAKLGDFPCRISRSGYTGEDGFEISVAAGDAEQLARLLLRRKVSHGRARRTRLSAARSGLCLYGHDIDEATTPVEAGLAWAIQKVRRRGGARAGNFPGADVILDQLERGASRSRVGILPEGRAPIREGEALQDSTGRVVGKLTSGGFGATLDAPLAWATSRNVRCTGTLLRRPSAASRAPAASARFRSFRIATQEKATVTRFA
jgi:aminomethyltransferase